MVPFFFWNFTVGSARPICSLPTAPTTFVNNQHPYIRSTKVLSTHPKNMSPAVQKPAPAFKATTVVEGNFQDVSLSDYLGQW